jgi:broad specificity phosphatase PhoE
MTRTWYLVRHGETTWNAESRLQGQWDSPLTERGRQHAAATGQLLARLGVDTLFASPLGRVRETVEIMAADLSMAPAFDDRLKEWSAGDWSGERYADLAHKWPAEFAAWHADRHGVRAPNGENFADLMRRARAFVGSVSESSGPRIAVIAHGYLNRALAGVLLSLPPEDLLRIRQANNTVIRIVQSDQAVRVDHFADGVAVPGLPEAASQPVEPA